MIRFVPKLWVMHPLVGELGLPLPENRTVVIGRGDGVDLELRWDARISRQHARVWTQGKQIWFEDLGSKNGSWYGSTRITSAIRFEPGMSVLVGETILFVRDRQVREETHELQVQYDAPLPVRNEAQQRTEDLRMRAPPPRDETPVIPFGQAFAPYARNDPKVAEAASPSAANVAHEFLKHVDALDLYGALGVAPDADGPAIDAAVARLERDLGHHGEGPPPADAQAKRIELARSLLARISTALRDPWRRLEHDFRSGHVRPEQRLADAKTGKGLSVSTLRRAWQGVFPDRVDRSAFYTRTAFSARQRGDIDEAIKNARAALADNPFFEELRGTLRVWEDLANKAR